MSDERWPQNKTPLDAAMGDPLAAGFYGDQVRDQFDASGPGSQNAISRVLGEGRLPIGKRIAIGLWFIAVFLVSALVSPYLFN